MGNQGTKNVAEGDKDSNSFGLVGGRDEKAVVVTSS